MHGYCAVSFALSSETAVRGRLDGDCALLEIERALTGLLERSPANMLRAQNRNVFSSSVKRAHARVSEGLCKSLAGNRLDGGGDRNRTDGLGVAKSFR